MTRRPRQLLGVVLPLLTIAVFATVLAFSYRQLTVAQSTLRIEITQNMLWVISRAEAAHLRLAEATAHAGMGDRADLHEKLDIWFSTARILLDEPQRSRMLHLGLDETLVALEDAGPQLEADIAQLLRGEVTAKDRLQEVLQPLTRQLGRAANRAMVAEWNDIGAQLDETASRMRQIGFSLGVIALAGAVLILTLVLTARSSNRRAAQLQAERAFSQLLVSAGDRGVVAFDAAGKCSLWNEVMEKLLGIRAGDALARVPDEISGLFATEHVGALLSDIMGGRARVSLDQPVFGPNGGPPVYVDLMGFPLRSEDQVIGAVLIASDVTERHDAQRELARHRDHLEAEVTRRTEELDAALTRERASLEIYRNFAAMVSHQFRTPLAVIDSGLQRLIRRGTSADPAEISERATRARGAVAQLVRLVESILDAARLDAGQMTNDAHQLDISELVQGIVAREGQSLSPVQIETGATPANVTGDATQIEHILLNLLTNARKYTGAGLPIRVTIRAQDGQVQIKVTNRGRIVANDRPHVFDRYYRGGGVEGIGGIGLGLYMARSLARLQGGDLALLDPPEDEGADAVVFALTLPATDPERSHNARI